MFSLCTVFGNGYSNWDSRITLLLEAQRLYPGLTLDELIQDEQRRAVIQALMRAPRSGSKTVCLYKGNLHPRAFPSFMHHRIVTTSDLLGAHLALNPEVPPESVKEIKNQIPIMADAIAKFILGEDLRVFVSKETVRDPLREAWPGRSDSFENKKTRIDERLDENGFVDKVKDKIGDRDSWTSALEFFVDQGYLRPENRGKKNVFMKREP
jgi:hypothetical protein